MARGIHATTNNVPHRPLLATAATLVVLLAPVFATSEATQDRMPATASVAGTWTLDPYVSDHPEQVARALRFDTGETGGEDLAGGVAERGGFGRGGIGRGAPGGVGRPGTARGPSRETISADDRKILTELTEAVRFPPTTLTIAQTETAITISTAGGASHTLQTNGKTEKYQLAAGTVDRTATWEGPQLLVAYEIGHAGTLTYSYMLAPTTGQLVIRVNFERRRGEPGPFAIKLVYNPAAPTGRGQ